jgi:hypothetical protein
LRRPKAHRKAQKAAAMANLRRTFSAGKYIFLKKCHLRGP